MHTRSGDHHILFFTVSVVFDNVLCDIDGSALGLDIGAGDILADYAEAAELNAAEQQYQHNYRSIALNGDAEAELLDDNDYQVYEREERNEHTDDRRYTQRSSGEGENALKSISEQLAERPLRLALGSLVGVIRDELRIEADP